MKEVIVNRSKWLRGGVNGEGDPSEPFLLNDDNHMCCLGFAMEQLGCPRDLLLHIGEPCDVDLVGFPDGLDPLLKVDSETDCLVQTRLVAQAIEINDEPQISEEARERGLTELFARWGLELKFI